MFTNRIHAVLGDAVLYIVGQLKMHTIIVSMETLDTQDTTISF